MYSVGSGMAIYVKDPVDALQVEQTTDKLELLSLKIQPRNAVLFLSAGIDHQPQM